MLGRLSFTAVGSLCIRIKEGVLEKGLTQAGYLTLAEAFDTVSAD